MYLFLLFQIIRTILERFGSNGSVLPNAARDSIHTHLILPDDAIPSSQDEGMTFSGLSAVFSVAFLSVTPFQLLLVNACYDEPFTVHAAAIFK